MPEYSVILSRSADNDEERRRFEKALLKRLSSVGADILVVPHLYHLPQNDSLNRHLSRLSSRVLVISWMHPRPAYWTLHALGIPADTRLICRNPGAFCCADVCADKLSSLAQRRVVTDGPGTVHEMNLPAGQRWYPVVDHSRCSGCQQCVQFCLFGVFSGEDNRPAVSSPENCKQGCPACSRVCPQGAIMFPLYEDDPAIAGCPGAGSPSGEVDVEAFFGDMDDAAIPRELRDAVRDEACGCDDACAEAAMTGDEDMKRDCGCEAPGGGDELDDLIGALEELDD